MAETQYDSILRWREACPEWLKIYVDLKLLLGLRKQDMLDLTHEQGLAVTTKKTGKKLRIEMTQEVKDVMARLKTTSGWFFQSTSGKKFTLCGFNSTWQRTMAKFVLSGGTRSHEHDLRGKVATDMEDAAAAKALLGHKNIAMTEAYIKSVERTWFNQLGGRHELLHDLRRRRLFGKLLPF